MDRNDAQLLAQGLEQLLKIKDSDIRLSVLGQGFTAIDQGVHIGGAFSATIPMVSLFYGGYMNLDIEDPTRIGQDIFVLSKGHAVATLASIYADLGYIDPAILENSRSVDSILNGHPGPILPGVHIATGPLAQGLAVAQGFAMAGRREPVFDVFCVTGDGELQEGVAWEAIMYAPQARLDNLCVLVDKNEGQLDDSAQLIFSMHKLPQELESFGWRVLSIDGTSYSAVTDALDSFAARPRDGRPTAIVCNTRKGHGAFSAGLNKHKITLGKATYETEHALQQSRRDARVAALMTFLDDLRARGNASVADNLHRRAEAMNLRVTRSAIDAIEVKTRTRRVPPRDKSIRYDATALPSYEAGTEVVPGDVISACMKVFARDERVVSVDADLGSTSGLQSGVGAVDQGRGHNVGVAESNMMCIGEAYAALGYNAWVSTFCPFFDWKVLRRIAVGYQERIEAMADPAGWLSEGHGLDLTFLATAPNFETRVNGATHMGNDDTIVFGGIGGLKIIDVSCPNQLVAVMRWVMDGNRGLTYIRIMRSGSDVLYDPGYRFEFGRAGILCGDKSSDVCLVSSGRGVHEIAAAARLLADEGISAEVVDMHSFDAELLLERVAGPGLVVLAEQNNGHIRNQLAQLLLRRRGAFDANRVVTIDATGDHGEYRYIHSATYEQLIQQFRLDPASIASCVQRAMEKT
ncbi:MAG: transketolase [Spirochaetaceae bacterium]|nr:MAG: transketolase [Spirochaetaceae bacterium]